MTKKYLVSLCIIMSCIMLWSSSAYAFTFEMVPAEEIFSEEYIEETKVSDWAVDEINWAESYGLITPSVRNYKTHNITRYQFAELIVNMVEIATNTTLAYEDKNVFSDCSEECVLKAYAAGIVSGMGEGKFMPDETTNREQIAAMIYRAIEYIEMEMEKSYVTKNNDISQFADRASVSDWALNSVGVLANNRIMNGTSEDTLSPKNPCTIEQSILLIYRLFTKIINQ